MSIISLDFYDNQLTCLVVCVIDVSLNVNTRMLVKTILQNTEVCCTFRSTWVAIFSLNCNIQHGNAFLYLNVDYIFPICATFGTMVKDQKGC